MAVSREVVNVAPFTILAAVRNSWSRKAGLRKSRSTCTSSKYVSLKRSMLSFKLHPALSRLIPGYWVSKAMVMQSGINRPSMGWKMYKTPRQKPIYSGVIDLTTSPRTSKHRASRRLSSRGNRCVSTSKLGMKSIVTSLQCFNCFSDNFQMYSERARATQPKSASRNLTGFWSNRRSHGMNKDA